VLEREAFGRATVVAKLQAFHWVWVDRDHTPELPKRFNVSAYPSLLVLGPKDENVHRWSGFLSVDKFLPQVEEARERYALFLAGKPYDVPTPRAPTICDGAAVEIFAAPAEDNPSGIVFCGGKLFVALGDTLYRLGPEHQVELQAELPAQVRDLASDGTRLWGITYSWTCGGPIHELDPESGASIRTFVTKANEKNKYSGAFGLAWHDGALHALESNGKLHRLDLETGDIAATSNIGTTYVGGLDSDGETFVVGSRQALHFFDPNAGKVTRSVAVNYPVRALAAHGGKVFVLEQPVFGFDRAHRSIRVWPQKTVVHVLTLPD
jgi:hypothetical protein